MPGLARNDPGHPPSGPSPPEASRLRPAGVCERRRRALPHGSGRHGRVLGVDHLDGHLDNPMSGTSSRSASAATAGSNATSSPSRTSTTPPSALACRRFGFRPGWPSSGARPPGASIAGDDARRTRRGAEPRWRPGGRRPVRGRSRPGRPSARCHQSLPVGQLLAGQVAARCHVDPAGKGSPPTASSIFRTVRPRGRTAGVEVRPHGVRHSAIATVLDQSGAAFAAQRFSRHQDLSIPRPRRLPQGLSRPDGPPRRHRTPPIRADAAMRTRPRRTGP